jgi:hypothetical protein
MDSVTPDPRRWKALAVLGRLAPRRGSVASWRVGPWPARGGRAGRATERFALLAGGPVQLLIDDVLITVRDGAVLRLGPEEARGLIVLDDGGDPVWLSLGPEDAEARG